VKRKLFSRSGLKVIAALAWFAAGAFAHEYFAGARMWEYHAAEAAAQVAEAEVAVGAQAEAVVSSMTAQLDAAGVDRAKLGETFVVTPEQRDAITNQIASSQQQMRTGDKRAGDIRPNKPERAGRMGGNP
jgi:hypothetical protein